MVLTLSDHKIPPTTTITRIEKLSIIPILLYLDNFNKTCLKGILHHCIMIFIFRIWSKILKKRDTKTKIENSLDKKLIKISPKMTANIRVGIFRQFSCLLDLLLVFCVAIDWFRHQEHKPQHILTISYPLNLGIQPRWCSGALLWLCPSIPVYLGVPGSRWGMVEKKLGTREM